MNTHNAALFRAASCDISVVIPCFNSAQSIRDVARRVTTTLESLDSTFEIILIDDSSSDDTWHSITHIIPHNTRVRGIRLQYNVGQHRATLCGLLHANGSLLVTLDDDLQHQPEDIITLLDAWHAHPNMDCIFGAFPTRKDGWFRRFGSSVMGAVSTLFYGKPRNVSLSPFRLMSRATAQTLCSHRTARPVIGPMLLKCTSQLMNVDVQHEARQTGTSGYSVRALASLVFDALIAGTSAPLTLVSLAGLLISSASGVACLWYLMHYMIYRNVLPGFTTLVMLICFFGGATLFSIGLLGHYVARLLDECTDRPLFVVREASCSGADELCEDSESAVEADIHSICVPDSNGI